VSASELRILFAGTPEFSVPALEALAESGRVPIAVLTQPDRPSGRGRKIVASPVKQCAADRGITVWQPASLRDENVQQALADLNADLMVVVAYGLILPQAVLDLPRHGCWNIHASLLPRWRGAAPIQRTIEAGDTETGVCIMRMEAGLDTGPVYRRERIPIAPEDTGGSLHDKLSTLGAEALMHCLGQLEQGTLPEPEPQNDALATYARKLDKAEARIDWSEPADMIARKVRAFNPWPVAWCEVGGARLRVWQALGLGASTDVPAGTIQAAGDDGIDVATGRGVLRLLEVQRPGGRPMSAAAYLHAHPIAVPG
jgi:methionyl-tRNA formyltransferase